MAASRGTEWRQAHVRRKAVFYRATVLVIALVILLFPDAAARAISGDGQVLTTDKEKVGNCLLSIEV